MTIYGFIIWFIILAAIILATASVIDQYKEDE